MPWCQALCNNTLHTKRFHSIAFYCVPRFGLAMGYLFDDSGLTARLERLGSHVRTLSSVAPLLLTVKALNIFLVHTFSLKLKVLSKRIR